MNERLKKLRKLLDISQAEFAKNLNMAQNSYSQIETGKIAITNKNVELICLKYGVNKDWLCTGTGAMFIKKDIAETPEEEEILSIFRRLSDEMKDFLLDMGRKLVKPKSSSQREDIPDDFPLEPIRPDSDPSDFIEKKRIG
jgi:transcriptional regulator with XRE-family HTH domain